MTTETTSINLDFLQQRINDSKKEIFECVENECSAELGFHNKIETLNFLLGVFFDDNQDWPVEEVKKTARSIGDLVAMLVRIEHQLNVINDLEESQAIIRQPKD